MGSKWLVRQSCWIYDCDGDYDHGGDHIFISSNPLYSKLDEAENYWSMLHHRALSFNDEEVERQIRYNRVSSLHAEDGYFVRVFCYEAVEIPEDKIEATERLIAAYEELAHLFPNGPRY